LKELIGHTPFQVAMGAVLGVAVGLAGSFIAFGV
ncbi:MAG: divergent PAP2 family protein, partial [Oscillospiraceae bacterium]|nr:divergent PAP2 family protein [Oscillospiraceae bacterium]